MRTIMKRLLVILLLAALAMPAARAEEYVTVQALYDETRTPWQATYFFPNSEDYAALSANYSFTVDLTPMVPQVERIPVLKVRMRPIELTEEQLSRFYQYDDIPGLSDSFSVSRAMGYASLKTGGILQEYPGADFFSSFYDEMDNARDNPLSPSDAAAVAARLWQEYLTMDNIRVRGVIGFDREPRFFGEYLDSDTPEGRKMYTLEHGAYTVVGEALLDGIPLLDAVTLWEGDREYPRIVWEITLLDENRFIFQGSAVEAVGEVYADVPLLPFSRIQEIYEHTLVSQLTNDYAWEPGTAWTQGKSLIHPLSAELGYLLMLPSGEVGQGADTTYVTKPVWILRGYVPHELWGGEKIRQSTIAQAQTDLRHVRSMAYGLFMRTQYMCIDAQTGEVLNWPNLGSNYWNETANILTWEGM